MRWTRPKSYNGMLDDLYRPLVSTESGPPWYIGVRLIASKGGIIVSNNKPLVACLGTEQPSSKKLEFLAWRTPLNRIGQLQFQNR